jgi:hypothetical protein
MGLNKDAHLYPSLIFKIPLYPPEAVKKLATVGFRVVEHYFLNERLIIHHEEFETTD